MPLSASLLVAEVLGPVQEQGFAGYRRYRRHGKGEIDEADDQLMRATSLMLVHGLGPVITKNRPALEAEAFDPLADERVSGRWGGRAF